MTTRAYRTTLRWSCDSCGLEQTIKTGNKTWATKLRHTAHERPCVDEECRGKGGTIRMPVKVVKCDGCTAKTVRTIKGGPKLPGKLYCSHSCKGGAIDDLLEQQAVR